MRRMYLPATLLLSLPIVLMLFSTASAQPSAAQLKAIEPKTAVSFTWHRPGKREWSSTYKKYVWSIYWTAKRKTDQPGVFVTIKGYSSFDIIGGRYVYWRDFVSTNSYDGQKPPSINDINAVMSKEGADSLKQHVQVGEYESLRLAQNPDWEWHTMNSVSFTAVAVYRLHYGGASYGSEPHYVDPTGKSSIDRVESQLRFRLYRDGVSMPWRAVGVSDRVPGDASRRTLVEVKKLLDRQVIPWTQRGSLPGPTRPPQITP